MRLRTRNLQTRVEDAADVELRWLRSYLSFEERRFNGKTFDVESVSLVNLLTDEFPTGLVPIAWREGRRLGYAVEIADERTKPCEQVEADVSWLRPHQDEALRAALRRRRGLLHMVTASGKTEIAIALSLVLPCRWLFLVHRTDLLRQTAERYEKRTGMQAGVIGGGERDVPDGCRFLVASFQTLHRSPIAGKVLKQVEGLIIDECHVAGSRTHYAVAMKTPNAYYRIGLSATPLARGDERNLLVVGALGPVIHRAEPEALIDAGMIAKPRIRMVEIKHPETDATWRGTYGKRVVRSMPRNKAIVEAVEAAPKPCLVFVTQLAHGRLLERQIRRKSISVEFAWGSKSAAERSAAVQRLERGDVEVVVCSAIWDVGIDIPSLRSLVVATGGKSMIAAVQRVGRGMRIVENKTSFDVWDIWDAGCGCDGDHKGCRWLERHSRERRRAYESEGFEVEVVGDQKSLQF